jgi:hypothetical protein
LQAPITRVLQWCCWPGEAAGYVLRLEANRRPLRFGGEGGERKEKDGKQLSSCYVSSGNVLPVSSNVQG